MTAGLAQLLVAAKEDAGVDGTDLLAQAPEFGQQKPELTHSPRSLEEFYELRDYAFLEKARHVQARHKEERRLFASCPWKPHRG